MTDFKPGDTVRVSFEGVVRYTESTFDGRQLLVDDRWFGTDWEVELVKRALPPEPTEPGTVVRVSYEGGRHSVAEHEAGYHSTGRYWCVADPAASPISWEALTNFATDVQILYTPGGEG